MTVVLHVVTLWAVVLVAAAYVLSLWCRAGRDD